MSIQKKSLINTLKTTKKANVVKDEVSVSGATVSPMKALPRVVAARGVKTARSVKAARGVKTARSVKATRGAKSPRIMN